MKKYDAKIDFVVLWVDPSDKEWQKSRAKYAKELDDSDYIDNSEERYRDWDLFRYWFRGVEKFAPWVNKVHLVTCGHTPKWLNKNHPKLHIVKHSDIMPKEVLPTFNSNAIELYMNKIPGLAENFVLFNDDMYIIRPVKPTDFFKNGVPVNTMSLFAVTPSEKRLYCRTLVNNIEKVNDNFDFGEFKKNNLSRCFSFKQGIYLLTTLPLLVYKDFPGFKNYHIAISYQKATFNKVWHAEPDVLSHTAYSRFRNYNTNISHWLMNYWQFAEGNYCQRRANFGINLCMDDERVLKIIEKQKRHILCLSEPKNTMIDVDDLKNKIVSSFEKILHEKGGVEK